MRAGGFSIIALLLPLVFYGLAVWWAVTVLRRLTEHSALLTRIADELRRREQPAQGVGRTDEP